MVTAAPFGPLHVKGPLRIPAGGGVSTYANEFDHDPDIRRANTLS
ncbi:hypothetical protein MACH17_17780 [Phaeobacter inhibens]|nr:hypothetical protein MACH17_17780 [Phaeobacter inhibens]